MRMTTKFIKSIDFFLVPNQVVEDDSVLDERYNVVAKVTFPVIDWKEPEVTDLDTITHPIEKQTKRWLDNQVAQLQQQVIELTYGELEDDIESEIDSGFDEGSLEAPKSP